jgi:putative RecB family exonuclease
MDIERLSASKYGTYKDCPEQFRLVVVEEISDSVGWYHAGGSAVHACTEQTDIFNYFGGDPPKDFNYYMDQAIAETEATYPDRPKAEWLTTGKGAMVENETWWRNAGPGLVAGWTRWLNASPFLVWSTPDGEPAIELEVNSMFGSVPSLGYIDRVVIRQDADIEDPATPLGVVDLKTGKPPKSFHQLATYAEACQQRGYNATWGGYYMAKGCVLSSYELTDHIGAKLTYEYEQAWRGIKNQVFPARPSGLCKDWCGVSKYCAWGGQLTDRSHLPYEQATESLPG